MSNKSSCFDGIYVRPICIQDNYFRPILIENDVTPIKDILIVRPQVNMFTCPEMMLQAIKRTQTKTKLLNYKTQQVLIQEVKFNGSRNHLYMRCNDIGLMNCSKPVCDVFLANYDTLLLGKQKWFFWEHCSTNKHYMFKNTMYSQNVTCQDEMISWDMKELNDLYRFYKHYYKF
jgi:predicted secreted protein